MQASEDPIMSAEVPVEGRCEPRFERVREIFSENLRSGLEIGASVAFTLDGETVVDLWGGFVDRERTRPWRRDTLVNLYSTTKGMTALCAHQLVESGALDLDTPVSEYWPEFGEAGKRDIPVRQLLAHQAGLPAVRKPLAHEALYDWDVMAEALAEQEPWWEPGTRHGYHALTFGWLVGELIRRVSGVSPGEFFRANVADPLEADFHIGLAAEHDPRTSDLHGQLAGVKSVGEERMKKLPKTFSVRLLRMSFMRSARRKLSLQVLHTVAERDLEQLFARARL